MPNACRLCRIAICLCAIGLIGCSGRLVVRVDPSGPPEAVRFTVHEKQKLSECTLLGRSTVERVVQPAAGVEWIGVSANIARAAIDQGANTIRIKDLYTRDHPRGFVDGAVFDAYIC